MKKYSCFVISPIGTEGTPTYEEYKDLFDLIIVPALEVFDIQVSRGDHFINDEKIDDTVIKSIQNADICICDISESNPNVYYELGRRDETGKPILLLKKKGTPQSPVDIANRRFFEYEWDGRYAIREAQNHIRSFIAPLIEKGFEATGKSATLADIADGLARLERKIDRINNSTPGKIPPPPTPPTPPGSDPYDKLKLALMTRNIPMAEEAMEELQYQMETLRFYDLVVEQVAAIGSIKAGEMLIQFAEEFFDSSMSFKKKTEYLGCLVTFSNRTDRELEIKSLVEKVCASLELNIENENPKDVAQIYNQPNRLYFGIYVQTKDFEWLEKAIRTLKRGIEIADESFLYYNLATCYFKYAEDTENVQYYEMAREAVDICISREDSTGVKDKEHYNLACRIYRKLGDPRFDDMFEKLQEVAPGAAFVLASELG